MLLNFSAAEAKPFFFIRLVYFLFLAAIFAVCRHLRLERILAPISGGIALVLFAYGIVQKLVLFPLILEQSAAGSSFHSQALHARVASGRVFAIFPLPTLYAMVCGLLLIFIIHYLLHARGAGRVFWLLLLLLGAVNLVLTESFGGILFFTVGVLYYLFSSRIFRPRYLAPLLMVVALVLFLVTALRFTEARELAPARLRFANWAQAGRIIAQAPLLGVGLGNYETAIPPHVRPNEPTSIYAHNFFLQLAAETGLPLFILLAGLGILLLHKNRAAFFRRDTALFSSVFVLLFFFNLFDVGAFFFVAGISLVIVLAQLAPAHWPLHPGWLFAAVLLAAPLLVLQVAANRQQAGDAWLSRQEPVRAEAMYRSAVKLNPWSYRAWIGLAHIDWERGESGEALADLGRVLKIFPGQPYANYLYARISWHRGSAARALASASSAARGNLKNKEYQRWHDFIQRNFPGQSPLPGD